MGISRATLPQEFFDITSAQLLTEPEPQYLHAKLIMLGLGMSLASTGAIGLPIPGRQYGMNGPAYGDNEADRLTLSDPIHGEAVRVVTELGMENVGHTVRLNRPKFVDSTYTLASRSVAAGTTISTTPTTIGATQVPITLIRLAGPYDNSQGAVAPLAISRFDAGQSVHSMAAIKDRHLKRDFDKTIDSIGVTLFDSATTQTRPRGFAVDNDSKVAGDAPLDYNTLARGCATMDRRNIPVFPNGKRVFVAHPEQCQQLTDDRQFNRLSEFDKGVNPLFAGTYWKSIGELDIFKSTNLTIVNNSSSVPIRYGQMFGPSAVGVGAGAMPRVAYNSQDNFGEDALVLWLWYCGMACLDSRFLESIRTS